MKTRLHTKEEIIENLMRDPNTYVAIYARESNLNAENAVETQIFTCKNYALDKNLIVYDIYQEFASASQSSYKSRREFMRLVEDAERGCFKKVMVTRRDRLTRRFEDFIEIKNLFKNLGVEIIYSNDIQINEGTDYACNFVENIIVALAEMEPRRISQRAEAGRAAKIVRGIYDKRPPRGLKYEKFERKYYPDGQDSEVIKSIFNIYLNMKHVKKPEHVLGELDKDVERKNEGKELAKKLSKNDVFRILSNPVYAGLQPNNINIKYRDFYVRHDGEMGKVSLKDFQSCENIGAIITPEQWYSTVLKWYKHNSTKKKSVKKKSREKIIFKDLFTCTKCGKILKYVKQKYTCGSVGCKGISKDILIRIIIMDLVQWLVHKGEIKDVIKDIVKKLEHEISKLRKILAANIKEQGELIKEYVSNASDDVLKRKIAEMSKKQIDIKEQIGEFNRKISFLNDRLEKIIIPLVRSNYAHLIVDELEKNQAALLEVFMYRNIKELRINGHPIRINDKRMAEQS